MKLIKDWKRQRVGCLRMMTNYDNTTNAIPLIDQKTKVRMQHELYYLIRRYCQSYEIGHFEAELFLHDSTRIKYTRLTVVDLDRFISLVGKYWDYFANLSSNLSFYEETISNEYSDKITGILDVGKTMQLRANQFSNNVVCSVNFRNICTPENVMLAVVLLGINIMATKFSREINEELILLNKYQTIISRILDYTIFLIRNKNFRILLEYYLI